jgi:hypothetical protein
MNILYPTNLSACFDNDCCTHTFDQNNNTLSIEATKKIEQKIDEQICDARRQNPKWCQARANPNKAKKTLHSREVSYPNVCVSSPIEHTQLVVQRALADCEICQAGGNSNVVIEHTVVARPWLI